MPRASVECPGCPPVRALTTDVLGLVKVVEAGGKAAIPKVVETWGSPDASRCVLATSFADCETNPLLAVARKNGLIEFLNPFNGDALATTKASDSTTSSQSLEDDPIVGLHLLRSKRIELSTSLNLFLTCTSKGKVSLRSISIRDASPNVMNDDYSSTWDVCAGGKVTCSSVDAGESYALFGGKGVEINLWDLDKHSRVWTAKSPRSNSVGVFSPTWFTAVTFLCKEDHRKVVAGTNNYQVRLYDVSAQRRPVMSVNFRESSIRVVTEDLDGFTVYVGTGSGDLASFDMRTGKLLGCFVGKCCGSIRSIARHPELPVIASCGLDSYLRLWDTKTRQLLSAVFLKQHLTDVVIDSHFSYEDVDVSAHQPNDLQRENHAKLDDEQLLSERHKLSTKQGLSKTKKGSKKKIHDDQAGDEYGSSLDEAEDNGIQAASKRKKPIEDGKAKQKLKHKKSKKSVSLA